MGNKGRWLKLVVVGDHYRIVDDTVLIVFLLISVRL